jgi:hypothetical protein
MDDALDPHERVTRRLAEAGPRRSADGVGTVILSHSGAVVVAVLLTFVLRALIDASAYQLSPRTLGVQVLGAAPVAVAAFVVAAAALGSYRAHAGLRLADALAVASIAVALQQPYSAVSGGTAKPLVMIPAQVLLLTLCVLIAERALLERKAPA